MRVVVATGPEIASVATATPIAIAGEPKSLEIANQGGRSALAPQAEKVPAPRRTSAGVT